MVILVRYVTTEDGTSGNARQNDRGGNCECAAVRGMILISVRRGPDDESLSWGESRRVVLLNADQTFSQSVDAESGPMN